MLSRLLESSSSSAPSSHFSSARSSIVADRRIPIQICRFSHHVVLFSTPPPVVTSSPVSTAVFQLSRFSPSVKIVASPSRSTVRIRSFSSSRMLLGSWFLRQDLKLQNLRQLGSMNLSGQLGSNLDFLSIIKMDISSNSIGGTIPSTLPSTLKRLNLSGNNLSGQLPPSIANLSTLTTLHLQNNQLGGTLFVLEDLPLQNLNIENNLFSGPIPPKLLTIPEFRKDGNPFNTTIIPSPPAVAPPPAAPLATSIPFSTLQYDWI
ncbi:hypothetical protein S83_035052 [Arachis hypogaea]